MSSIHIPRVLSTRGKTSADLDRENFERSQTSSIQKAINQQESAVKEKHARIVIIGTHQEKGCSMYWSLAQRLPLQEHPIVAWKFCHVTHKLLRDGHPNVLQDSQRYTAYITDLGKLWGHLKEGYGRLIASYIKLLVQKLRFHKKNNQIPGNLMLGDEQLEKICNHDINTYFELSVDMLDYMDDVIGLQNAVFGCLDTSRANSMTSSGQCRLAPLILCVQDSCQLYDYLVRILFRLHSCLPPDTLTGHRDRFYNQYRSLKQFYYNTQNLQYFKNLIRVPTLPDSPPDFLRASDLNSHVKPMAVVPEPVEPEPVEQDTQSEFDHAETVTEVLVDTSLASSSSQEESFAQNGNLAQPREDEKDQLIKQLMWEVNQLRRELSRMKAEDQMVIESLHNRVKELELELSELHQIAESTTNENEELKNALKEGEKSAEVSSRLAVIEKIAKGNEEKFKKMKDIYTKLREEHVHLLKEHSDNSKKLNNEKKSRTEAEQKSKALEQALSSIAEEKVKLEADLLVKESSVGSELTSIVEAKERLLQENQDLEMKLKELNDEHSKLQTSYKQRTQEVEKLESDLQSEKMSHAEKEQLTSQQKTEIDRYVQEIESIKGEKSSTEQLLAHHKSELEQLQNVLKASNVDKSSAQQELIEKTKQLEELKSDVEAIKVSQSTLESSLAEKSKEAEKLREDLDRLVEEKTQVAERNSEQLKTIETLETKLKETMETKAGQDVELDNRQKLIEELTTQISSLNSEKMSAEEAFRSQLLQNKQHLLACAVAEAELIIREALAQADNPHHSTVRCTAEYLLNRVQPTLESLNSLKKTFSLYSQDKNATGGDVIQSVYDFSHFLADVIVFGFATSQSAPIEPGEELANCCRTSGDESLALLAAAKTESYDELQILGRRVDETLRRIMSQAEELIPKIEDVQAEKMGDMVDEEMLQTTKAIEQATAKLAAMLASSREQQTGIQLEVNEKILDSCNNLMKTIKVLIEKSKSLQREIVGQGRGTSSIKDFYKKHHRWTEGLISAAKAVGWGANVLVDAADKVVKGKGKFEELVVCSQEIAASTAQLVVSSKVKAQRDSDNLRQLAEASKHVSAATGEVVASAKSGAERIEDIDTLDFSKLTLHQAKRLEMESQVHVLELESNLEKERKKLSELRKTHYKLAGESEGWEQEGNADAQ